MQDKSLHVLALSILVTSICAIVYQLLIGSLSSYLLGSSILHFSLTIGCFMFFMGLGSYLSRYVEGRLIERFIIFEYSIGLVGGFSAFVLYLSYSLSELYYVIAFALIAVISTLIGLEIPLVTRFLHRYETLKGALSTILSVDYLGALIASILFPIVLLPYLGIMRTSFSVGLLNCAVAMYAAYSFKEELTSLLKMQLIGFTCICVLALGAVYSTSFVGFFETFLYQDEIVYSEQTKYQKIVMTRFEDDIRLYLDGNLQFSSTDEYRYHEPLVHVPLSVAPNKDAILVLGGGDGMAVRELLKYEDIRDITLVDLDPRMTQLANSNPLLMKLNKSAFSEPRVKTINQDAYNFLKNTTKVFSAIIIDLPDPNNVSLGKLYSKEFYELVKKRLSPSGLMITQSSSPYLAREAFWCIHHTLEKVFSSVTPIQIYVPSFGPWGFNIASHKPLIFDAVTLDVKTVFLDQNTIDKMTIFDRDMAEIPTTTNRLDNQSLLTYYEKSL